MTPTNCRHLCANSVVVGLPSRRAACGRTVPSACSGADKHSIVTEPATKQPAVTSARRQRRERRGIQFDADQIEHSDPFPAPVHLSRFIITARRDTPRARQPVLQRPRALPRRVERDVAPPAQSMRLVRHSRPEPALEQ